MKNKINHWVISDTHFSHDMLVKKGYRPENFENPLLINLKNIQKADVVYHLGDVSFYKHAYWHSKFLKSSYADNNILILGNHDRKSISWYYEIGWSCVCSELTLDLFGMHIKFSHIPMDKNDDFFKIPNAINVHGHIHNTNHRNAELCEQHKAVIMEHEYKPVLLKTLLGM